MTKEGEACCPKKLPAVPVYPVPPGRGVTTFSDQVRDPPAWLGPRCCFPGAVLSERGASVQHPTSQHPTSAHSPSHGRSSPCWPLTVGGIKNNFANIAEKPWDNFAEKHYFCVSFYGSVQCPAWHGRTIGYGESLGKLIKLALLFHRLLAKLQKPLHP